MKNLRKYGNPPFRVVVVHGGPGAAGEMAPVARELSSDFGVLEPLQTRNSLRGQVEELRDAIEAGGDAPVKLVGWSWGAWLGWLLAARYPDLVAKLVLVGSGPFEDKYAHSITSVRQGRLSAAEREELRRLQLSLDVAGTEDRDRAFGRIGEIIAKADSRDPVDEPRDPVSYRVDIFERVWPEAERLRKSGDLLRTAAKIACPVVAIHGDYDPHPANGVREPLSRVLKDFRFILLERCGHEPWIEREARDEFYRVLRQELA